MSNVQEAPTYRSAKGSPTPARQGPADAIRAAALRFLSELAAELTAGTVELPCFPDIFIRIRKALSDPKTTVERMVTIVGTEPRLAARLLQTANSAAFKQAGKPIVDLKTAITRLGHQLVQSAAMAFAVQQMKNEEMLRSIAKPLNHLWQESIAVASICQVMARRTKVSPDEAFLTGLLHGIGRMYIMVRAASKSAELAGHDSYMDIVSGWQASIGKAVLENWSFAEEMCQAVGAQDEVDRERKRHQEPDLSDILIAAVLLSEHLSTPAPRMVEVEGVSAFSAVGLTAQDCTAILTHADYQLGSLHDTLGC